MIRFEPISEPGNFDADCRIPGQGWLLKNPNTGRPKDYWSPFRPVLVRAFRNLCGYCAMATVGDEEVDHYVGCGEDISLAYEWSNYRCCKNIMNKRKGHRRPNQPRVLDPFEVEDDWFELLLPSLQLVLTDRVPCEVRDRAAFTLRRLGLRDDERIVRLRRQWLELYEKGDLSLAGLETMAPLIARAVRKRDAEIGAGPSATAHP